VLIYSSPQLVDVNEEVLVSELLLLGLLNEGRMHGYQMNEILSHFAGFIGEVKSGTAYNALRRLERDGFIEASIEREGKRPERKVYELTESGRDLFMRLLRDNLEQFHFAPSADQEGFLFIDKLSKQEAVALLGAKRAQAAELLEEVQRHPAHGESLSLAFGHALAQLTASIQWLEGAISTLGKNLEESYDG
jgi:DNA-binding PadR family transcriptional regulator